MGQYVKPLKFLPWKSGFFIFLIIILIKISLRYLIKNFREIREKLKGATKATLKALEERNKAEEIELKLLRQLQDMTESLYNIQSTSQSENGNLFYDIHSIIQFYFIHWSKNFKLIEWCLSLVESWSRSKKNSICWIIFGRNKFSFFDISRKWGEFNNLDMA